MLVSSLIHRLCCHSAKGFILSSNLKHLHVRVQEGVESSIRQERALWLLQSQFYHLMLEEPWRILSWWDWLCQVMLPEDDCYIHINSLRASCCISNWVSDSAFMPLLVALSPCISLYGQDPSIQGSEGRGPGRVLGLSSWAGLQLPRWMVATAITKALFSFQNILVLGLV